MPSVSPTRRRRAHRGPQVERRKLPRIPLAIPVRYATEAGDVGIGALCDITVEGAGLIVPQISRDALHVWMQFLWFDDNVGLQGRITHARDVAAGRHVGLHLQMVSPKSLAFITRLLIPYGLKKTRNDYRQVKTLAQVLASLQRGAPARRSRRQLPVLVAQGAMLEWAITEYRDDRRAVLLLPQRPAEDGSLILTSWGRPGVRRGDVLECEALPLGPARLYRVLVRHAAAGAWAPAQSRPSEAASAALANTSADGLADRRLA